MNAHPPPSSPAERVIWHPRAAITLWEALQKPTILCLEQGVSLPASFTQRPEGDAHLMLCLSTARAYANGIAQCFVDAIAQRITLGQSARDRIETALNEAVANAVIHGNLEIASRAMVAAAALTPPQDLVAEQLQSSAHAERRVTIGAGWTDRSLTIFVADEGRGYQEKPPPSDTALSHGRGLMIQRAFAESVSLSEGGRRIDMSFAR
jgi:hypothetical protein